MNFKIDVDNSKYTFIYEDGKCRVLRYGEEWKDLTGDNFVFSMAYELYELRQSITEIHKNVKEIKSMMDGNEDKINQLTTILKGD